MGELGSGEMELGGRQTNSGGWQQSGELTTGDPDDKVTMACNFPRAEFYTVQFSVDFPVTFGDANPIQAIADLEFSIEGNTVRRRVNIADGMTVAGMAQAIKVYASDDTQPYSGPVGKKQYPVSMQVARGSRGNYLVPPTLVANSPAPGNLYWTVPAASTVDVPVPQNVGVTGVWVTVVRDPFGPIPEGNVEVAHIKVITTLKIYDPRDQGQWVPLSPGATTIALINNDPLNAMLFTVTFAIDG